MFIGNNTGMANDPEKCPGQGISDEYWIYLAVSGVMLFIVCMLVAMSGIYYKLLRKTNRFIKRHYVNSQLRFAKEAAMGENAIGKVITVVSLVINAAYFALYWRRTYLVSDICLDQFDPEWRFELAFTIYFILYFCWRSFGKTNRLAFWLDMITIIDLVTIPHIFVSLARDRDWLGL